MHKQGYDQVITPVAIEYIAKIAELVGRLDSLGKRAVSQSAEFHNLERSVQATLDIDSADKELNHSDIYDLYKPTNRVGLHKLEELLSMHRRLFGRIDSGVEGFRSTGKGVYMDGELVHAGSRYSEIPILMEGLFNWLSSSKAHPLIKSTVVHFEILYIQPFTSNNGLMARLCQRLILSEWNDIYSWLPLEVEVLRRRNDYFDALYVSSRAPDIGVFLEFMLEIIYDTLSGLDKLIVSRLFDQSIISKLTQAELEFLEGIAGFIEANGNVTNKDAQRLTGLSAESVKKYLSLLSSLSIIEAKGEKKGRRYILPLSGDSGS